MPLLHFILLEKLALANQCLHPSMGGKSSASLLSKAGTAEANSTKLSHIVLHCVHLPFIGRVERLPNIDVRTPRYLNKGEAACTGSRAFGHPVVTSTNLKVGPLALPTALLNLSVSLLGCFAW